MKIVCDNCGTRYSVNDEKVKGKIFKIRCKKCEEVIVVRGGGDETTPDDVDPRKDPVWHVLIDGEQQGPYTPSQVSDFIVAGEIDFETHCWREGFSDWKLIEEAEELYEVVKDAAPAGGLAGDGDAEQGAEGEAPESESAAAAGDEAAAGEDEAADSEPEGIHEAKTVVAPSAGEPAKDLFGDGGLDDDEAESIGGFTAPESEDSAPLSADGALSDVFGVDAPAAEGDSPSEASIEAARAAGRDGGADLFASVDDDTAQPEAGATAAPPAKSAQMTGARNENSVLFSLNNLQSLATASDAAEAPKEKPKSSLMGTASGSSGLIDIKTLAADAKSDSSADQIDDEILSMGGGFGAELGTPVLTPVQRDEGPNKLLYAVIGVGVAVVVAVAVLIVVLMSGDDGDQPVAEVEPQVLAPEGELGAQQPAAPVSPAAAVATPSRPVDPNAPAPVPITEDTEEEEDGADQAKSGGSSGRRHVDRDERPSKSGGDSGESSSPAASESSGSPAPTKADPAQVKRGTNALESLLDGAIGGASKAPASGGGGGGGGGGGSADPSLPNTPSRSQVQSAMNSVAGRVRNCGNGQSGTVMVNVVVQGATGRVSGARVSGQFAGTPVGSCAARAVRGARFPRFNQSTFSVRYPFQVQ